MSGSSDTRPPLLYLVHRLPYPPNKGDKVRSFNILRELAKRHRVFLGTFVDLPEDMAHVDRLDQWCEAVFTVRLQPGLSRIASLRGLLTGEALSVPYYRHPAMRQWIQRVVSEHAIREAVVFSGPMAQYLDGLSLTRRVIDFCDVDSAKWSQYAQDHRWPMSWLYRREGRRLLAFERTMAQHADASLFVTQAEAELFKAAAPECAERVGVMQNGVDAAYFDPAAVKDASPYPQATPVVVFSGAMDYWPNIDAVCWFVEAILPRLHTRFPTLQFWVVGMNPAPQVSQLAGPQVVVTGTVPDVRPYLAHADVVVAPLRIARGIQNKVLEAMAIGRPVVVSAAAAQGLEAVFGVECVLADDESRFAEQVAGLLDDPAACLAMGAAARQRVVEAYSWSAHLSTLEGLLCERPDGMAAAAAEEMGA